MKNLALAFILVYITITSLYAQKKCKYEEIDKITTGLADYCNTKIDTLSKPVTLCYGNNVAINANYGKGEGKYYFALTFTYGNNKKGKIEFCENNSLDFYLNNGEKLKIYPCMKSIILNVPNVWYTQIGKETKKNIEEFEKGTMTIDQVYKNYDPMSDQHTCRCLYQITREQLQKLSENEFDIFDLYFTSEEKVKASEVDTDGKSFFKFESRGVSKSFAKDLARCILNN